MPLQCSLLSCCGKSTFCRRGEASLHEASWINSWRQLARTSAVARPDAPLPRIRIKHATYTHEHHQPYQYETTRSYHPFGGFSIYPRRTQKQRRSTIQEDFHTFFTFGEIRRILVNLLCISLIVFGAHDFQWFSMIFMLRVTYVTWSQHGNVMECRDAQSAHKWARNSEHLRGSCGSAENQSVHWVHWVIGRCDIRCDIRCDPLWLASVRWWKDWKGQTKRSSSN